MARLRLAFLAVSLAIGSAARLPAADLLPADKPVPAVIDFYVDELMKADGIEPAAQADDYTLVRRLTLDLAGRIPTVAESEAFVASTDPDKRAKLVDRLIASPAFARFQAIQFDTMLSGTVAGDSRSRGSVREYLETALKDGKGWDAIFRGLMLPDQTGPKERGPAEFLRARVADADRLTNDVSVAFFGVNVSCAQCHDHPLVADWKQDHFYGMKSFLARTYDAGGFLAERPAGVVKFKPTKGPERTAKLMFLTGTVVETDTARDPNKDEQKAEKEAAEKAKSAKQAPPAPQFSARATLVDEAMKPGAAEFFARNLVNRLWHRFLGSGLVNPLDQMHSENPASHPELLAWLARDTAAHGYDVRRLARGIVLSQTYSRASTYPSESHPQPRYFAVARLRALTPAQLGTSLKIATRDPASFREDKPAEFEKTIEQLESAGRGLTSGIAQPTEDDFQIGVGEALLFSNADRMAKDVLADSGVLSTAKAAKTPADAVGTLVRSVYARPASPTEIETLTAYVSRRNDRTAEAYRQVLWALVTSPEFRFNH